MKGILWHKPEQQNFHKCRMRFLHILYYTEEEIANFYYETAEARTGDEIF